MSTSINRRALVKGTAWAAPAVLATATIPAYAASVCSHTSATPGSIFGAFKLSFADSLEKIMITLADGSFDTSIFKSPYWYVTSDQKVAYWVPGLTASKDGVITLDLKVLPNDEGKITAIIDVIDCTPLLYNGSSVSVYDS